MQADPPHEEGREEKIRILWPSIRNAYLAFEAAGLKAERRLKDEEAYKILKEEGIPGDAYGLADYRLPAFDTWSRHLRAARKEMGEQKNKPRHRRPHGKSIVERDKS